MNPKLSAEWHPTLNGELKPMDVSPYSNKKVWWRCTNGHDWSASVANRGKGTGCPYCSGKRVIPGQTDLSTLRPDLAAEWHSVLNGKLNSSDVTVGSGKKVWWRCKYGHEWQATVYHRSEGIDCPYCSGRYAIPLETDLSTVNPMLATEWHQIKNGGLKPTDVTAHSEKRVWWLCMKGHEWQAIISSRNNGHGCPFCAGQRVILGKTDLATINPALATEWHPTKNGELNPTGVTAYSNIKAWWRCKQRHEWKSTVYHRSEGLGCPYCSGRYAIPGETDLSIINPALATEWHPMKNGELKPTDVTGKSNKYIWWQCKYKHEWKAQVNVRARGRGCPYCSGRLAIQGETDLVTVNPKLAGEWHPTKNGKLKPTNVSVNSKKNVWWRCISGHEWYTSIGNRNGGKGCPYCARKHIKRRRHNI